jgi:predicted unusual protein kinase regulating ubiquinone biosynthesis (AarF/ABC1/UbiB family)
MQWSSTREDLFPESLCSILGRLHDQAPTHSYKETRKAILEHLKRPIEAIFDDFPTRPCASGSIAQVSHELTAFPASFRDIFHVFKCIASVLTYLSNS